MDLLESVHNYFSPNHNDTVIELITVDGKFYFDLTILKYFTRIEHCKIINNKIYLPYLCSEHMTIITKIINHLSVHKTLDDYIFDDIHITKSFYDAIYLLGFDIMVKKFKFLIENKLDKIINLVNVNWGRLPEHETNRTNVIIETIEIVDKFKIYIKLSTKIDNDVSDKMEIWFDIDKLFPLNLAHLEKVNKKCSVEYNEIVKLREYEGVKLNQLFGFDQSVKRNQLFGIDQSVSSKYNKNRFGNYDGSNYKYTLIVQTDALWGVNH